LSALTAVGLMSGTSLDGVDVAVLVTDGETIDDFGPTGFRPYTDPERAQLREALVVASGLNDRAGRPGILADAERVVTLAHAEAVEACLAEHGLPAARIDVVGFHGQTVLHRPDAGMTVQIGDAAMLASRLGIPVVHDFRAADVAAGGQGAPFVPVFHRALVERAGISRPVVVLNVGGVANITFIDDDGALVACDTGPGNALIDDFMLERTGVACDRDGVAAAHGHVDDAALARLLEHPFFIKKPPKSLDRNAFSRRAVSAALTGDGAATLTAFTAAAAARVVPLLPKPPVQWVVCGGGAHNPTMMRLLTQATGAKVLTADKLGWIGDAVEAQAFAYLAVRSIRGLPLTFPGTTGVREPTGGGVLVQP